MRNVGYTRTLVDLSWAALPVQLRVRVRRFRCDTLACQRQTFTEPLATVAGRSARTTTRLTDVQTASPVNRRSCSK